MNKLWILGCILIIAGGSGVAFLEVNHYNLVWLAVILGFIIGEGVFFIIYAPFIKLLNKIFGVKNDARKL